MKVIALLRMWDKTHRGHETLEQIATSAESIMDYVVKYCYAGFESTRSYELSDSWDGHDVYHKGIKDITEHINYLIKQDRIDQMFLWVKGSDYDGDHQDSSLYRIQIRNLH